MSYANWKYLFKAVIDYHFLFNVETNECLTGCQIRIVNFCFFVNVKNWLNLCGNQVKNPATKQIELFEGSSVFLLLLNQFPVRFDIINGCHIKKQRYYDPVSHYNFFFVMQLRLKMYFLFYKFLSSISLEWGSKLCSEQKCGIWSRHYMCRF